MTRIRVSSRLLMAIYAASSYVVLGWTPSQQSSFSASSLQPSVSRKQEEGGGGGRRYFLLTAIRTEITAATIFINPLKTNAAAPMDAGEAIRRSAANIPGYGPTDVFFPSGLVGSWTMNREVEIGGRTIKLSYPFRFIQSIEDDAVVADRGSNQAELEKSLIETLTGNSKEASSFVLSYEWAINNPNDLRLVLADGTKKEIKVTKRATERSEATVTSSEFQRVTQENQRGIPVISARRILTKWKIIDDSTIEGIEVIYSMGGGDPMAGASGAAQPSILSKSRLFLIR